MPRLIVVSNRLPVSARKEHGKLQVTRSAGGLATGLAEPHQASRGLWIGWPGTADLSKAERGRLDRELRRQRLLPVYLTPREVTEFYTGFSNGVLWPLFHYLLDRIPEDPRHFDTFQSVTEKFAAAVAEVYRPGDLVWIHDYQLMLLPAMVRRALPDARIGFFLHIPFPATDVFSILPWRSQVLEGLLGADLIGFHTYSYMRNFSHSLVRLLGVEADVDRIPYGGREVSLGVYPIGIDAPHFSAMAADAAIGREAKALRERHKGRRILLGVDRLDYTKGLIRRLLAYERLLENPEWRGKVSFVQVAVPSREKVNEYKLFRSRVEEVVGRVNGAHGSLDWTPVDYLYRSFTERQVAALYRAADVMLVTPLRDGMNLVAKEFVASRADEDGVLVLSEQAGAASQLGEALLVNPYDVGGMAVAIDRALHMPRDERRTRMRALRQQVLTNDVRHWASSFIDALAATPAPLHTVGAAARARRPWPAALGRELDLSAALVLLLDYDGTLVGFQDDPQRAAPDGALLALLARLAARPGASVHVVTGRTRENLEEWLGHLPVGLHAEHGLWSRPLGGEWSAALTVPTPWKARVRPILDMFVARTPGTFVEDKPSSLAWHYRRADTEIGTIQANKLRLHLGDMLRNVPVQILPGDKVVEVRHHAVHKGLAVASAMAPADPGARVAAFGDDVTDEDMFAALPPEGIAVKVGFGTTQARFRIGGVAQVRRLLAWLARKK